MTSTLLLSTVPEAPCAATIDFASAEAILRDHGSPLGVERVPLGRAGRRRLAAPLVAEIDAPKCNVAAMDGFAVRSRELAAGRRRFGLCGATYAGSSAIEAVPRGGAVRVTTGAPMPFELDQVVVWEEVIEEKGSIWTPVSHQAKKHVRTRGSDFTLGAVLLPAGRVIDPRAMVVAAASGAENLAVWRQPRVACLASGNELTSPGGSAVADSSIPDSLSEAVALLARQWGAKPNGACIVGDDVEAMTTAGCALLDDSDVLVIIGGAAGGDRDFAKASLAPLGLSIHFSDVAMKPGKPVWYGKVGPKHVLGLPGNPTAALTVARLFLAPLLVALSGGEAASASRYELRPLAKEISAKSDREQFLCATNTDDGVELVEGQSASMQSTLAHADVLVRIPAGVGPVPAGTPVQTLKF